ncbi:MAG: tetratricopeptide repeat protein [Caldilineales bacterium]|nr:tetratricopeptide repeat protein [Caldilineales bacterium]
MSRLELHFLGVPQITLDGKPIATDRRKAVALLAYLALADGACSRERLAALFWPDYDTASASAYLRRTLWEINHMLGPGWIEANRQAVSLPQGDTLWLDVAAFRHLTSATGDIPALSAAVALHRDTFLTGFSLQDAPDFDDWQRFQTEALCGELASAYERLAAAHEAAGDPEQALATAQRWLQIDRLHEPAHRLIMRLCAQAGQRTAALRQYEACRAALAAELGVEPEPATLTLYHRIRSGELAPAAIAPPAPMQPAAVPMATAATVLPIPATPFLGRAQELAEITAQILQPHCRLLTLIGPGGSGKTRLALAAAARLASHFPDGVFFAALAPLTAATQLGAAIAQSIGLNFYGVEQDPTAHLTNHLRGRRLLIVLDNFEHLLDDEQSPAAGLLSHLIATAPGLRLLVTSRLRLRLSGEHLYPVPGLPVSLDDAEGEASSALQLFLYSARQSLPAFALTPANRHAVAAICQMVGGLPLAIELAAGWVSILSPHEIQREIARSLDILASDQQDRPDRQRSMRAVFDATWQRLPAHEQEILMALAIFRGPFDRDAARQVAGASPAHLLALAGKSLVRSAPDQRFELHELLRQYSHQRLSVALDLYQAARGRYIDHYLALVQQQGALLQGPQQRQALDRIDQNRTHVQTAWLWALADGRFTAAAAIFPLLHRYLLARAIAPDMRSLATAGLALVDETATAAEERLVYLQLLTLLAWAVRWDWGSRDAADAAAKARARIEAWGLEERMGSLMAPLAAVYAERCDAEIGFAMMQRCVDRARAGGSDYDIAWALSLASQFYMARGDYDTARHVLHESATRARHSGDRSLLANSLLCLGYMEGHLQNFEEARRVLTESQELFAAMGHRGAVGEVLYHMGISHQHMGAYAESIQFILAGRQVMAELGDAHRAADMASWAAVVAREAGDFALAWQWRQEALAGYQQQEDEHGIAWCLWEMADLSLHQGRMRDAHSYVQQALEIFERMNMIHGIGFCRRTLGELAASAGEVEAAATHYQASLALAQQENYAWGVSFAHNRLGQLALQGGRWAEAESHLHQALAKAAAWPDQALCLMAISGLAALALAQEDLPAAAMLLHVVREQPVAWPESKEEAAALEERLRAAAHPAEIALWEAGALPLNRTIAGLLAQFETLGG